MASRGCVASDVVPQGCDTRCGSVVRQVWTAAIFVFLTTVPTCLTSHPGRRMEKVDRVTHDLPSAFASATLCRWQGR
jgi:hypothetical protein